MKQLIKDIWGLLTAKHKRVFWILQSLMIIGAFVELFSLSLIAPFIAVLSDNQLIQNNQWIAGIYDFFGFASDSSFILFFGVVIIIILTASTILSMLNLWAQSKFANHVGAQLGDKLFKHYLSQDWLFHTRHSSASLTKQITTEARRVTDDILMPMMLLCARGTLACVLSIAIIWVNPMVAVIGIGLFITIYFLFFKLLKTRLSTQGAKMSEASSQRFKLMNNAFGGIKEVILLNRQSYFQQQFVEAGSRYARNRAATLAQSVLPRYFIELVAFSAMIGFLLVLYVIKEGDIVDILPLASLYAVAGLKILPALQQVYRSVSMIQGNRSSLTIIKEDLAKINNTTDINHDSGIKLSFKNKIELKDVSFSYADDSPVIDSLSLEIEKGHKFGIKGKTGSGKSTLLDILMGMIVPTSGAVLIDGVALDSKNRQAWQRHIALVSQDLFLIDGTLKENVAFGIPADQIDESKLQSVIDAACLKDFVDNLPSQYDTWVGERGVKLSGGQKQRVAIARALYHNSDVLIFDEATSALDSQTEQEVMNAINQLGDKTIIMVAHRLETLSKCSFICDLDNFCE